MEKEERGKGQEQPMTEIFSERRAFVPMLIPSFTCSIFSLPLLHLEHCTKEREISYLLTHTSTEKSVGSAFKKWHA
jgi:hypothetical protein